MTERPIIFSAPMVRALLACRKTQARRILRYQPEELPTGFYHVFNAHGGCISASEDVGMHAVDYVPYAVGDRLWVRESVQAEELSRPQQNRKATPLEQHRLGRTSVIECDELDGADGVRYVADAAWTKIANSQEAGDAWSALFNYRGKNKSRVGNLVPSIHMPRWASRLTLDVTGVRVQRLQDVSEEDAIAEGVESEEGYWRDCLMSATQIQTSAAGSFRTLWLTLHGAESWDANPWICALTFTVCQTNIDSLGAA